MNEQQRKAMVLALEALEKAEESVRMVERLGMRLGLSDADLRMDKETVFKPAITAIKEILAHKEPEQEPWLLETTQTLAKHMAREFYPEVTQWECLDNLAGVISQIDNMTTGLMRKPEQRSVSEHLEHVAYIGSDFQLLYCRNDWSKGLKVGDCLYTTPQPPQRPSLSDIKPLTDEQIKINFEKWAGENYVQGFEPYGDSYHNGHTRNRWQGWLAAHRFIEAAHGIKE